jgi:hypothetical protein
VLVLVVVLVLDLLGFCDEKEVPSVVILFDRSDGEISTLSRARGITLFTTALN